MPDQPNPQEQLARTIIGHQIWLTAMVLAPALAIWYNGDDFIRRVGLPLLFAFGAAPILFSAAFGLGVGGDAEPSEDLWDKLQEVWTTELGGEQGVAVGVWNGNDWIVRVQGRDTEMAG
ncbi:MAG: hypothetical protein ALECFALPRED_000902 [Alectoria fallacina]|uniref:Uncharacterized protein n=1 Tax=Alectoria fallacina TaxID=1903189 RepID=A0A8H3IKM8_9LECA|nr:MAG: hypothetical protein ALECFALPRED_000902 [Alectoria fallacina]